MTKIISWNVLYRGYEELYCPDSTILSAFPKETERVAEIVLMLSVVSQVDKDTVVCLQEVSSDVIAALLSQFGKSHTLFSHCVRNDEYLVTIAPKHFVMEWSGSNDICNACLSVSNDLCRVVNCHLLPQRYAAADVMEYLLELQTDDKLTLIAGDFNEVHKTVKERLHDKYVCPYYGKTYKKKAIDQIVFTPNCFAEYETGKHMTDISDHHLIYLEIKL